MDLLKFYIDNVDEKEYHHNKFNDFLTKASKDYLYPVFDVYDAEDAIKKFKELCQPMVVFDHEKKCWFYLVTFYLNKLGYKIKEFPNILARPPIEPSEFTENDIKNRLASEGKGIDGTIRYKTRRQFVSSFTFELVNANVAPSDWINKKLVEISTRNASFYEMSTDEKLTEIINLLENLLKIGNEYRVLDYPTVFLGFIDNETIKTYRSKLQCFRHAKQGSLDERKTFTEAQKNFMIDYGITILNSLVNLIDDL